MKQAFNLNHFIIVVTLLISSTLGQSSPTWERNNNIDAGEVKPINAGVLPNDQKPANFTYTYNQKYNKTDFSVFPRVFMAQLNFGFPSDSSNNQSSMGYNITMTTVNLLTFDFIV